MRCRILVAVLLVAFVCIACLSIGETGEPNGSQPTDNVLSPRNAFVPSSSPTTSAPRIVLSLEDRDREEIGGVGADNDIHASLRQMNAADPTPAPTHITNVHGAKQNVTNSQRSTHVSDVNRARKQWKRDRERCEPFSQWHKDHFPTCNNVHAMDLSSSIIDDETGNNKLLAQGSVRTSWLVQEALSLFDGGKTVVFRTTQAKTGLTWDILDGQQKDAVITEKLSASPNVIDIFGYCGGSTINELGDGGDLKSYLKIRNNMIPPAQLHSFATDMMRGMRDIHFVDKTTFPTMMQKDVKRDDMVVVNGTVKYHDFNSARFLEWDFNKNICCGWEPSLKCDGRFSRSPEDCNYEEWNLPRDWPREKKDIYTVGALWFNILTGGYPFDFEEDKEFDSLEKWLKVGRVPAFPTSISNSNDPWMSAMTQIIQRALTQDMYERPSAKVLADDLEQQLKSIHGS